MSYEKGIELVELGKAPLDPISGIGRVNDMLAAIATLNRAIRMTDADVYYQRTGSALTGIAAFLCGRVGKPLVFASSSYWNATENLRGRFYENTPLTMLQLASPIYRYGLSRSAAIVTQTDEMARLFRTEFPRKDVRHIPPLFEQSVDRTGGRPESTPPFFLYVSRLIWYRRPLLFIRLARKLPHLRFVIAGYGPDSPEIEREAKTTPNVVYLGKVSPEKSVELISTARAFVNTSMVEGFPNTLLESAACGTPYVSFFDPDEVICRNDLGIHVRSFDELVSAVDLLAHDDSLKRRLARAGKRYLQEHHDPQVIARMYNALFSETCESRISPSLR